MQQRREQYVLVEVGYTTSPCPPRDLSGGVERERLDRRIAVGGREPVESDDLFPRFVSGHPQVGIRCRVVGEPRQLHPAGPAEDVAEVAEFNACHVLDQTQQVGPRRRHRPADIVFAEPVELSEQVGAPGAQVAVQNRFVIHDAHSIEGSRGTTSRQRRNRAVRLRDRMRVDRPVLVQGGRLPGGVASARCSGRGNAGTARNREIRARLPAAPAPE